MVLDLFIDNMCNQRFIKVRSSAGILWVETPRDRNSDFEPSLIAKRQRDLTSGLDEQSWLCMRKVIR